ncbi:Uncharacterized protein Fot_05238 [Forsythia ovata]|uniref:Uncharacterized protein n=1 Tax=Forsythia ovata TaxID=205694 RepID=A0ABD1WPM7_9LAMI
MSALASDAGGIWGPPTTASGSCSIVGWELDIVGDAKWGREASSTIPPRLILNFGTLEKWKLDMTDNNHKSGYDGRIAGKMRREVTCHECLVFVATINSSRNQHSIYKLGGKYMKKRGKYIKCFLKKQRTWSPSFLVSPACYCTSLPIIQTSPLFSIYLLEA